ncbi:hypothetical protein B5M42_000120 [Paenibacillus athensensis]|uniref:Butirosin biosynthesis protein H N-terminal domain-containing protein n=1 Tax=Paenibacillus athensensis TaxID=1967502 RepID=A0A4Y8PSA5_9BACL|nr:hypothetical protein [Paenibacillus athensensis]MCD1257239.1 hypothetical protein [Paenibacillus athensensis]
MTQDVLFARPQLYTAGTHFIDCTEFLICSSIKTRGLPFHWLFSDNWGFSYRSLTDLSALEPDEPLPFWMNLEKLYGMKQTQHHGRTLEELAEEVILARGSTVILTGDIWDIPWSTICYRQTHMNHDILITGYNPRDRELYVVDFVPDFAGWVSFDVIDAFFTGGIELNGSTYGFELSAPQLAPERDMLLGQLSSAHARIQAGLAGLQRLYADLDGQDDCTGLIDIWWNPLKQIVAFRESFQEFLLFLRHHPQLALASAIPESTLETLETLTSKWFSFRNNLKKLQMKGQVPVTQIRSRLAPMIGLEADLLNDIGILLATLSQKE